MGPTIASLLLFPLMAVIAIGIHSRFGGPALALRTTQLLPQAVVIVVIALGEEYGANATFNYLPLLPEFTGQIVTFWLFLGLVCLTSIGTLIAFGPTHLARNSAAQS
jgi:hypothetical protein